MITQLEGEISLMKLKPPRKLTSYQRRWVKLFYNREFIDRGAGLALPMFLSKLKVLNKTAFIESKDAIIDKVQMWYDWQCAQKYKSYKSNESKNYNIRPPKSIKPTKARF